MLSCVNSCVRAGQLKKRDAKLAKAMLYVIIRGLLTFRVCVCVCVQVKKPGVTMPKATDDVCDHPWVAQVSASADYIYIYIYVYSAYVGGVRVRAQC